MNEYDLLPARELHALYWREVRRADKANALVAPKRFVLSKALGRRHKAWINGISAHNRSQAAYYLREVAKVRFEDREDALLCLKLARSRRAKMEPLP